MKVKIPFEVKYKGKYYTANVPFEAEENDLEELILIGGAVVGEKNSDNASEYRKTRKSANYKPKSN